MKKKVFAVAATGIPLIFLFIFINQRTGLHRAVEQGHITEIRLLANKRNINKRDFAGYTPLDYALESGNSEISALLLKKGASPDSIADAHRPPLFTALKAKNENAALQLISFGADLNIRDEQGKSPLDYASDMSSTLMKEIFIKTPSVTQGKKNLLLFRFITEPDMVSYLLQKGAHANALSSNGNTVLIESISQKAFSSTSILIKHGADVNLKDSMGITPLFKALESSPSLALFLLEQGADPNIKNSDGNFPLAMAVTLKDESLIKKLLSYKPDLSQKDPYTISVVSYLKENYNRELTSSLTYNTSQPYFGTLGEIILTAAGRNDRDTIEFMLYGGGDVNYTSSSGNEKKGPPLLIAAVNNALDAAGILIKSGASLNKEGYYDEKIPYTPFQYALAFGSLDVAELLLSSGVNLNRTSRGRLSMEGALKKDNIKSLKWFLSRGGDIKVQDITGRNALVFAALHNSSKCTELLLKEGADPTYEVKAAWSVPLGDIYGPEWSIFKYAEFAGATNVLKLLKEAGINE